MITVYSSYHSHSLYYVLLHSVPTQFSSLPTTIFFLPFQAILPLVGVSDYRKFAVCLPFETDDGLSLGYVIFLMFANGVAFSILMGCYLKVNIE